MFCDSLLYNFIGYMRHATHLISSCDLLYLLIYLSSKIGLILCSVSKEKKKDRERTNALLPPPPRSGQKNRRPSTSLSHAPRAELLTRVSRPHVSPDPAHPARPVSLRGGRPRSLPYNSFHSSTRARPHSSPITPAWMESLGTNRPPPRSFAAPRSSALLRPPFRRALGSR
jgi:hypothetical protein